MPILLNRLIDEAADRHPEATAVRCDGEQLTYHQLTSRANGLARVLLDAGVRPRDRVAVLLGKGLSVPVAFYGVLASGGILVPIDPTSPAEQVARIIRASGAQHLVTEPGRAAIARRVAAAIPELVCAVGLDSDAVVGVRCVPWRAAAEAASDDPPTVRTTDLDPAYILHTSGSTGAPKLILHTHRSAMAFVEWAAAEYALSPTDRLSNHSSHHTCFATFDFYAAARAAATTVILPPAALKLPASLAALLERERVTVWYSVPTALVQLSLRGALEQRDLRSIRWCLFAGERFPDKHLRRIRAQLPGARFSHVYGSTEVNVCTYYHLPATAGPGGPLPIGRPCATTRAVVVDDSLKPVPPGGTGELLIHGDTVMAGYWGEPERSRLALVNLTSRVGLDEVYFRTGDRVRQLADGNLEFVARTDFQVKVRGHRVELEEVESALLALEPVEEAAAFTVADGEASSAIRAAVVVREGSVAAPHQLLAELRAVLPGHAVPTSIDIYRALPRTPTGKVDRRALQTRATTEDVRHVH